MATADDVLELWFGPPARDAQELMTKMWRWFASGPALDPVIRERFGDAVARAVRGELDAWGETARGSLAIVILLDQLTRHVYRDDARMYAGDIRAQAIAARAFERGFDEELDWEQKPFLVMPFAHAESVTLQERALALITRLAERAPAMNARAYAMGIEQSQKYGRIVARFGRFPHRNALLGRRSTPEELEFLRDWAENAPPRDMRPGQPPVAPVTNVRQR